MIINIRGTSGSGKSHLVREVMKLYSRKSRIMAKTEMKRKQPLGYLLQRDDRKALVVIGHYETPCGGCDTIQKMDEIFDMMEKAEGVLIDVIYEGLLLAADVKRAVRLHSSGKKLHVIGLDTDINTCIDSINGRRRERMGDKYTPVATKNTISKHRGVVLSMEKLAKEGIPCEWHNRESAFSRVKELLEHD